MPRAHMVIGTRLRKAPTMMRIRGAAALALVGLGAAASLAAGTPLAQMVARNPLAAWTLLLAMPGGGLLGLVAWRGGAGVLRLVGLTTAIILALTSAAIYAFWGWTLTDPQGWVDLQSRVGQGLLPAVGIVAMLTWAGLGKVAKPKSHDSAPR